ncbi:MAG: CAP domain-containing protein [Pseudomonadota bacterium]
MKARLLLSMMSLSTAAPAAQAQSFAATFPARVLAAHNVARAQIGVPLLVWDNALGTAAAAYAQQMAITGVFEHSNRAARRGIGENLWMGTHGAYSIETMVGDWVGEKRYFLPGTFPAVSRTGNWIDTGHYTQVIWPTTQRIGCALASTARTDYLVCRYSPAGNIDGRWVGPTTR